ncbi:hypothetical protein NN561_006367 [Cricetulus griseus]
MSGALTKRLDTCVYPTPRIVHSSSRSPQTNCGCTGLQQGCPARPGCTRALAAQGSPPRAPAGHVPRRGRDPRPDTRKTPSKKLAATRTRPPQGSVEPAREAHGLEWAAWGGGRTAQCAARWGPGGTDGRAGSALGRLNEVWRRAARRPDGWGGPGAAEPGGQVGVGSAAGETGSPSRRGPDPRGALAAGVTSQLTFLRRKDKLLWLWVSVSANVFQVLLRLPVLCEAPAFLSRGQGAAAAFVSPLGSAVPPRRRQRTRGKAQGATLVREKHLSSRLCLLRDNTSTARLYKEAFQPRSPVLNSCHGE